MQRSSRNREYDACGRAIHVGHSNSSALAEYERSRPNSTRNGSEYADTATQVVVQRTRSHEIYRLTSRTASSTRLSSIVPWNPVRNSFLIVAVVQKSSQRSGRTNLMCPKPSPSYRITIRSNRFSKHWKPRRQRCSANLTFHFSPIIPCSAPRIGAEHGCTSHQSC